MTTLLNTSWSYFDSNYVYQMFPEVEEFLDIVNEEYISKAEYLTNLCKSAEAEFHNRIQNKYTVPLVDGDKNYKVKELVLDLLIYFLHKKLATDKIPVKILKSYEAVIKELDSIAAGKTNLAGKSQKTKTSKIAFKSEIPVFEDLEEYN